VTTVVKQKADLVVPQSIRRQAGIKVGDQLEFKVSSRRITITAITPAYRPNKAEVAAIHKGEAEIARGEFVTLDGLLNDLDHRRRKNSAKAARKNSR
jgi:bifunctional DNA-binding transcriptional regulator/antitoxin component of YhaV-PrlF toxin-antitoxin module